MKWKPTDLKYMNALLIKIQSVIDLFQLKNQRPDVNEILNIS